MADRSKLLRIIERIENGESERSACEAEGMNRATFRNAALREKVDSQYARALEGLAMDQVEKMEKTIEDMRSKTIDAQMARVEIDARKWFASKFLPKRFGDKIDMTTDGEKIETTVIYRPAKIDYSEEDFDRDNRE